MADYGCDGCGDEQAAFSVTAFAQSDTQFLGPHCMGILGATILSQVDPEALAVFLPAIDEPIDLVPTDLEPASVDSGDGEGATITEPTPITQGKGRKPIPGTSATVPE